MICPVQKKKSKCNLQEKTEQLGLDCVGQNTVQVMITKLTNKNKKGHSSTTGVKTFQHVSQKRFQLNC